MKDAWSRIEVALSRLNRKLPRRLGPPASVADIERCESSIGVKFPPEFRESLLIHGGDPLVPAGEGQFTTRGAFQELEWLTPKTIESEWRGWNDDIGKWPNDAEAFGPVKKLWWNPKWIPFTLVGGSTYHHCVDLDPADGGTVGQIIEIGMKETDRIVVAAGMADFLANLAADLESGAYEYDEDSEDGLSLGDDAGRTLGGCKSKWYPG